MDMKAGYKIISIILAILMLPVCASASTYADKLYELGLFKGTENGYELESPLTREQSAVMLVRLNGAEENVLKEKFDEAFTDVKSSRWSFPYVMYCYEKEITKGTGNNTFTPESDVTAEEYITLVLRMLGYTESAPETAFDDAIENMLISSDDVKNLKKSDKFTREQMVYITYRSLQTKTIKGVLFAEQLSKKGVITSKQASELTSHLKSDDIDGLIDNLLK